jgi:fructose-1,6-bisphosphatase/inositol monophosphatase family enzyme
MIDEVGELLREAARTAVLPRFRRLDDGDVAEKEPGELVTVADRESEELLAMGLTRLLPGSVVVGEEGVAERPDTLDRLADAGPVWLVDPLDGTRNFAAGRTPFAMMVALQRDGATVAAWLLDPVADTLAVAERGSGAYVDGVPVRARTDAPAAADLRGAVLTRYLPEPLREQVGLRTAAFRQVSAGRHCAGVEYPGVVAGSQDFALFWRTLPWDHAPGALFVREAGGVARHVEGDDWRADHRRPGLLVAANPEIWQTAQQALFG